MPDALLSAAPAWQPLPFDAAESQEAEARFNGEIQSLECSTYELEAPLYLREEHADKVIAFKRAVLHAFRALCPPDVPVVCVDPYGNHQSWLFYPHLFDDTRASRDERWGYKEYERSSWCAELFANGDDILFVGPTFAWAAETDHSAPQYFETIRIYGAEFAALIAQAQPAFLPLMGLAIVS